MSVKKPKYFSGILSALIISFSTFFIISSSFGKSTDDWMQALDSCEWFAWLLAITIFLVPLISGIVCGHKGRNIIVSLDVTFLVEFLAMIVAFVIGFIAALLSALFADIIGIVIIVSLFIAFTATPAFVIYIIE